MPWEPTVVDSPPQLGPCQPWVDASLLPCQVSTDPTDMDVYAAAASQLLYQWSGRQFGGVCTITCRPCGRGGCWPDPAANRWRPFWQSGWYEEGGTRPLCGCTPVSRVPLPTYPVASITQVTIGPDTVDPLTYRLDDGRLLTRLDGWWPYCQNLRARPGEAGAFVVTYTGGQEPPAPGVLAAGELTCWLVDLFPGQGTECKPPASVTSIARQGVSYQLDPKLPRGKQLPLVSEFLDAYNPRGMRRRGAVFSPDLEQYARREGV